jgi:Calcineurin-like phosphoesterase
MTKILLIADIHDHWKIAQQIVDTVEHDLVVFLGDYFDSFWGGLDDARATATWLKQSVHNPKHVHLVGNHDLAYLHPCRWTYCSGNAGDKHKVIYEVLANEDWAKLKPFHYVETGNWLCSHAGIARHLFERPDGLTLDGIDQKCKDGLASLAFGQHSHAFAAGYERGGGQPYGGIVWQSFETLTPIKEFRQICAHTPSWPEPQVRFMNKDGRIFQRTHHRFNGWKTHPEVAVNLDTHLKHYGILEDGKLSIHETARIGLEKTKEMELL